MAAGPITSWQIDGENVEETDFLIFIPKSKKHHFADRRLYSQGSGLFSSLIIVRAGLERRQSTKELAPSNFGAGKNSWEFLGQQEDQTSQS